MSKAVEVLRKCARIHIRAEQPVEAALEIAAARQFTSKSEYLRRALLKGLRADGIDPAALSTQHAA